jgi:hypothetical protein
MFENAYELSGCLLEGGAAVATRGLVRVGAL